MSIDKSAVLQIQESGNIPSLIQQIKELETKIPIAVRPDSMAIESMESYMPFASRYRMKFSTTSIKDFIEYNTLYDNDGATCFVNAKTMSGSSLLDLGSVVEPGHKSHRATISLEKTAAFSAVLDRNESRVSQKAASEFIEEWADLLVIYSKNGDKMSPTKAALSLQNLTIETAKELNSKVSDFGASLNSMERIEAKNQDLIPAEIEFTCEPYSGIESKTLKVRVGILTGDDRPKVVFRILGLESLSEEIAEEFKQILVKAFKDLKLKTFIGKEA